MKTRRQQQRLKRRSTRHRKRAGALLGKGAYGCGFFPGVRCRGDPRSFESYISKLVDPRTAAEEMAAVKPLRAIDPHMKYTVYPIGACYPAEQTAKERRENPLASCEQIANPYTGAVILQSPYGGESLFTYMPQTATEYMAFFESLANLLEGLDTLHSKDYAHMDIKMGNIVTMPVDGTKDPLKIITRYIDFGLGLTISDIPRMPTWRTAVYAHPYNIWPYETRFLYKDFKKAYITPESVTQFLRTVYAYKPEFIPAGLYAEVGRKPTFTQREAVELWEMYQSLPEDDRVRHLAMATDIYMLGLTMASTYAACIGHFAGHGENIHFLYYKSPEDPSSKDHILHNHRDTLYWEPRLGSAVYTWHLEVAEEISLPFFALCRQMMSPMPFSRPEAGDALNTYTSILSTMRRLFSKDRADIMMKSIDVFYPSEPSPNYLPSSPAVSSAESMEMPTPHISVSLPAVSSIGSTAIRSRRSK